MLKAMKVAKHLKSDGTFCIFCVFRTPFTFRYCKVVKIRGLLNHSVKISNSMAYNVRMSDEWYFERD